MSKKSNYENGTVLVQGDLAPNSQNTLFNGCDFRPGVTVSGTSSDEPTKVEWGKTNEC